MLQTVDGVLSANANVEAGEAAGYTPTRFVSPRGAITEKPKS